MAFGDRFKQIRGEQKPGFTGIRTGTSAREASGGSSSRKPTPPTKGADKKK